MENITGNCTHMFDFRNRQNGACNEVFGIALCEMIENKKPVWTDNSTPVFITWSVYNANSELASFLCGLRHTLCPRKK